MQGQYPFIDGDFFVYSDGRRLLRLRGAEGEEETTETEETEETTEENETTEETEDEGKTFDAAYVKKLRQEAAKYRTEAQAERVKVKKFEDASKSDQQKLEERATTAETRATAAEKTALRIDVALDKAPEGMSVAQVRKLAKRLSGDTKEELEADAEELFAEFASTNGDGQEPSRRPKERLRPGAAPGAEPEETDPAKLAAQVSRDY